MNTQTIEIDFDVHKAIEVERRSFEEAPNAALRRLLGIDPRDTSPAPPSPPAPPSRGRPWVGKGHSRGLTLPHGTELRFDYRGKRLTGQVVDGSLVVEGQHFDSPSAVAVHFFRNKQGERTHLNGKALCDIRLPGESRFRGLKGYEVEQLRKAKSAA